MSKKPEELAEEYTTVLEAVPLMHYLPTEPCRKAFLAGYKAAAPQWISVKTKLPEDHRHYIVVSKAETVNAPVWYNGCQSWQMELAYYSQRYERWMTGNPILKDVPEKKITFEVTHWQELPEPPKEEG